MQTAKQANSILANCRCGLGDWSQLELNFWQLAAVDRLSAAMGYVSTKTLILKTLGCLFSRMGRLFGHVGHHSGDPGIQGHTQWTH
jgi:hypothetical protein